MVPTGTVALSPSGTEVEPRPLKSPVVSFGRYFGVTESRPREGEGGEG